MRSLRSVSLRLLVVFLLPVAPVIAQTLTGRVVSPALVPLAGIVVDAGSSTPVTTDPFGVFTIGSLLLNNTYDVEFVPPFGAMWVARIVTVTITGPVNLGDVVLQPGFPLTGHVQNPAGLALPGCNLNVYNQAGVKQFTPIIEREACVWAESESFLQRVFQGAAKPLLMHFAENSKLSADEVRELKRLLEKSLKKEANK